jgi:hypothetical protein
VGYDLHITRAPFWIVGACYPIWERELADLIEREPDLWFEPDRKGPRPAFLDGRPDRVAGLPVRDSLRMFGWDDGAGTVDRGEAEWLQVSDGQIQRKWPGEALTRRMAELARELDAWLMGDDGELYVPDAGGTIAGRDRVPEEYPPGFGVHPDHVLVREESPIGREEWLRVAAGLPDFSVDREVEVRLPSGWRAIRCPEVARWTGHPSGRPVPFFHHADGYLDVHRADPATVARMRELAPALEAEAREL